MPWDHLFDIFSAKVLHKVNKIHPELAMSFAITLPFS
jgi:hypothetical protein